MLKLIIKDNGWKHYTFFSNVKFDQDVTVVELISMTNLFQDKKKEEFSF
jgi:hypothetical protein